MDAVGGGHFLHPLENPGEVSKISCYFTNLFMGTVSRSKQFTFIYNWNPILEVDNFWKTNETVLDLDPLVAGFHFGEVFQVQIIVDGLQSLSNLVSVSVGLLVEEDHQVVLILIEEGKQLLVDLLDFAVNLQVVLIIQPVGYIVLKWSH